MRQEMYLNMFAGGVCKCVRKKDAAPAEGNLAEGNSSLLFSQGASCPLPPPLALKAGASARTHHQLLKCENNFFFPLATVTNPNKPLSPLSWLLFLF